MSMVSVFHAHVYNVIGLPCMTLDFLRGDAPQQQSLLEPRNVYILEPVPTAATQKQISKPRPPTPILIFEATFMET